VDVPIRSNAECYRAEGKEKAEWPMRSTSDNPSLEWGGGKSSID